MLASVIDRPRGSQGASLALSRISDVRHVWGWIDVKDIASAAVTLIVGAALPLRVEPPALFAAAERLGLYVK